jgi:hypothetical protein
LIKLGSLRIHSPGRRWGFPPFDLSEIYTRAKYAEKSSSLLVKFHSKSSVSIFATSRANAQLYFLTISTTLLKRYAGIGNAKILLSSGLIIAKLSAGFWA